LIHPKFPFSILNRTNTGTGRFANAKCDPGFKSKGLSSAPILTPPLECGLLDGTLRRWMLDSQAMHTRGCVLTVSDLASADRIYLGNSVRGLTEVGL